ncbi:MULTISPECIES: pyrimidine-nucleoside phosphorylase [Selenomonas]|uniref:Pyrimidine-nucleoside phosphorylase n=1 Tax=Selenomonas ruminis TaxID=2593411 RepID=A0A5D6WA46_9FIRM|nr:MULTISPECIES: pyrimidine-nucleoside phosphorylase [unclassified Selenomonas]MBQ1866895.1 pyrimidine-nucleoside phosphorylase [Selenomonas sp.]TYZ23865.1 pyrimidine-nucleoside phosphorylase [Selenomonas sp. mPRGC5]
MRMYDLITKKKHGEVLTDEEIQFMITGYVNGDIPDYQMSAMTMAIWFNGMNDHEITELTKVMAKSGDMIDLSAIEGKKVDKHSTGGVGDKTTLIVAPIVAACGGKVAKMSGRGLGHTGGTVDKLEAIPGYRTVLDRKEFFDTVNKCGVSVIGQSGNLAPADKKLYALRDVTATVDSIPLIASSIMSKKLAAGSDCILLDVKTGSGAFMKTLDDSIKLAQTMVAIGEGAGRRTVALITDMDTPLGFGIGNSLEVMESMDVLKGHGPEDLTEVSLQLASNMLYLVGKGTPEECRAMAEKAIEDGSAFETFCTMVKAQGGDDAVLRDYTKFAQAPFKLDVVADRDGFITKMNAEEIGETSVVLGAGRETKESDIDFSAGLVLHKKFGDAVKKGDSLVTLYTSKEESLKNAERMYREAVTIGDTQPEKEPLVYARVEKDKVEKY